MAEVYATRWSARCNECGWTVPSVFSFEDAKVIAERHARACALRIEQERPYSFTARCSACNWYTRVQSRATALSRARAHANGCARAEELSHA